MSVLLPYNDAQIDMVAPINWMHPLNRGLVGWWQVLPGLAGGSQLWDLTRQNPGTLTNMDPATDWVADSPPGQWGSLDFDGANDYVGNGTLPVSSFSAITVSTWFQLRTQSFGRMVSIRHTGGDDIGLLVTSNALTGRFDDGTNAQVTTSFTDTSQFHHVSLMFDGSTIRMFLDGVSVGSTSDNFSFSGADGLTEIGRSAGVGNNFDGRVATASVHDRALSDSEVSELYRLSQLGYPGMLNRSRRRTFSVSAGGGPTIAPLAWNHLNKLHTA